MESGMTLAEAQQELEERRNDVARCMAELEAAHAGVKSETGPKILKVTLQEVYGDITVDRVAVRISNKPSQEKVIETGIPAPFTVGAESFDLVFLAERPSASAAVQPPAEAVAAGGEAVTTEEKEELGVVQEAAAAATAAARDEETSAAVAEQGPAEAAAEDTAAGPGGEGVVVDAADASPDSVAVEAETKADVPRVDEPAPAEASEPASTTEAAAETLEGEKTGAEASSAEVVPKCEGTADAAEGEAAEAPAEAVADSTPEVGSTPGLAAEPAVVGGMGCSTVTTEVVVPSSELKLDSPDGQWRYLPSDAAPADGDENGPVEVSMGIRFSASMEAQEEDKSAEGRIVELSQKYDRAALLARAAEARVEQLTPATAASSDRRSVPSAGGARKAAGKKAGKRKQDSGRSGGGSGKGKGPIAALSAGVSKFYTNVGRPVVSTGWVVRNFVFFVSSIVVIHYHGEYLSV